MGFEVGPEACAQDILMAKTLHDKIQDVDTILVGWEHENIEWLVYNLNAQKTGYPGEAEVLAWPDTMFDYVVDIHYEKGEDGIWHHSSIEVRRQNIDTLTPHGINGPFWTCPNCKGDTSPNRRRNGCPDQ